MLGVVGRHVCFTTPMKSYWLMVQGGGSENMNRYPNCTLVFLGIDNIHVVREAFAAFRGTILEECTKVLHINREVRAARACMPFPCLRTCGCSRPAACPAAGWRAGSRPARRCACTTSGSYVHRQYTARRHACTGRGWEPWQEWQRVAASPRQWRGCWRRRCGVAASAVHAALHLYGRGCYAGPHWWRVLCRSTAWR